MKQSPLKRKTEADPQAQIKEAHKEYKLRARAMGLGGKSHTGSRGQYYKGEWIPSEWQLECLQLLEFREKIGEIVDLASQIDIDYTIYNERGQSMELTINMDFVFFDNNLNRSCRWDAKPPKVAHHKGGKSYPQAKHKEWLLKFKQLKFCQPDYDYRILEKGRTWRDYDFNLMEKL